DVLEDPRGMLRAICAAVGVPFIEAMLSWPAGTRETDGVWAPHWYGKVEESTSFDAYTPKDEDVPPAFEGVLAECERLYATLMPHRLMPLTN
ncbi:MAG: sulfotransferase-like domain-containing protein, partial [Planctomycetota bacterium]